MFEIYLLKIDDSGLIRKTTDNIFSSYAVTIPASDLLVGDRESLLFLAFAQVSSRTRLPSSLSLASHRLQGNGYFSSLDSSMISTLSRNQFAPRNLLSCQMRTLVSSPKQEATITSQICGVEIKKTYFLHVRQIFKGGANPT